MPRRYALTMAVLAALCLDAALGQTPLGTAFTYQGRLVNGGSPANGLHDLRFSLYDAASGGNLIDGPICLDDVSVTDGLFTASVDFGPSNVNFAGDARWLAIEVRADSTPGNCASGSYTSLTPRQALTPAPFALGLRLPFTATASNAISGLLNLTSTNGPAITGSGGPGSGGNAGVSGLSSSTGGIGVFGRATSPTGTTYGGWFQTLSSGGYGVRGDATAASGTTYGVYGTAASSTGCGVYGESGGNSGSGVYGHASAGSGTTYGVQGQSASSNGTGVYGLATAAGGTTYGVFAQSDSGGGTGVYGLASAASGTTFGGHFASASTSGRGVYGTASATGGFTYGVYGQCASAAGYAVYGHNTAASGFSHGVAGECGSPNGKGVYGLATATGANDEPYGVYGSCSNATTGYAVYALGDLGASGVKLFRIDHPDDPANKYLLHYATESPEAINFYRGTVLLDAAGEAVVDLPNYFAKINKTPSYQLTAVGAPMPMLHVAEEIDEAALSAGAKAGPGEAAPMCSFRIAGGAPGAKVSWRVEAVRNDRWVRRRGAPVEVGKQGLEKGTYQHPELYDQPAELGMNYDAEQEHPLPPTSPNATQQK